MSRSTIRVFFAPVAITFGSKRLVAWLHLLAAGILVAMALIVPGVAQAQNGPDYWSGADVSTSNSLDDGANWVGGAGTSTNTPPTSGDSWVFGSATGNGGLDLINNLTTGISSWNVNGITFSSGAGAFVIGDGTATDTNVGGSFTLTGGITNSSTSLQTINDSFAISGSQTITTSAGGGNITLGGNISGSGGITLAGGGTLTLTGSNSYTGQTQLQGGTLNFNGSGAIGASGSAFLIAADNNNSANDNHFIAAASISNGTFTTNDVHVGDDGGEGYLSMTGGTINPQSTGNGFFTVSQDGGFGQFDMSGGTINASAQGMWFGVRGSNAIANFSGTAQVNITTPSTPYFELGWDDSSGQAVNTTVVTQSGSSQINSVATLSYFADTGTSGSAVAAYNLNGGTLSVPEIQQVFNYGKGYLNFNGGTLQAHNGASSYGTFITNLTGAYIYAGGGTIDTQGNTVTIGQALLAPPGYGLSGTLTPNSGGSGYTVPPNVVFASPASGGSPATGYAQLVNGSVADIVITNPGSGYANSLPVAITLTGGGGSGVNFTNPTPSSQDVGGGLTKVGIGTLTLTGANTYTGGTIVNAGTLTVGAGGTLGATTGPLQVNNTNASAGNVVLNLLTTAPTTTGSLSGTISPPSSGTNTATINNGGQLLTVNQTTPGAYLGVIAGAGGFTLGSSSTSTLTLSGANTYTGNTSVLAGTLDLANSAALQDTTLTTGGITFDSAVSSDAFTFGGLSGSGNVALTDTATNNVGLSVGNTNSSTTYSGSLSGGGSLTTIGTGILTLSGENSYTGATLVSRGTLALASPGSMGNTSITVGNGSSNNGTLRINGNYTIGAGTASVAISAGSSAGNGSNTGQGTLLFNPTESSPSTLTINGSLAFGGIANSSPGVLMLNFNSSGIDTINTNSLTFNTSGATLGLNALLGATLSANTYTIITSSNPITNPGGLTFAGDLTTTQIGSDTFTISNTPTAEQLTVTQGTTPTTAYWYGANDASWTSFHSGNPNPTNWVATASGGLGNDAGGTPGATTSVFFSSSNAGAANFATTLGSNISILGLTFLPDTSANPVSIGPGSVASNTLTVGTGGITVNSGAGATTIGANVSLGASQAWTNQSTSSLFSVSGSVSGSSANSTPVTLTLADSGGGTTISGSISDGTGTGSTVALLIDNAGGTTTLSGANSYTGGTNVSSGTLRLSGPGTLGTTTGSLRMSGGTLDLGATSQSVGAVSITAAAASGNTIQNGSLSGTSFGVSNSSGNVVITANLGGSSSALNMSGAGALTLGGANTYGGGTTVSNGELAISGSGTLGATSGSLRLSGGLVDLGTTSQTVGAVSVTAAPASGNTLQNGSLSATSYSVSNSTGTVVITANLGGSAGLTNTGAGTLTLSGNNSYTGQTELETGTVNFNGSGTIGAGGSAFLIGGNNVTGNNNFVAAMYLSSGTFTTNDVHVGDDGGEGYLNMTGGTFNPQSNGNGYFTISQDGGFGQIDMSGGTINASQQGLWFGVRNSNAIANFSGNAQVSNPSANFELGWDNGTASNTSVVTQSGSSQITSIANLTYFGNAGTTNANAIYNLNGGTLTVPAIAQINSGNGYVNFNGGTLQAYGASGHTYSTFITGLSGGVYIYSGGGTIDTQGNTVTIGQALLAPTGYGLSGTLTPSSGGSGYTVPPNVVFAAPAGGTPATGYAQLGANGSIADIVITNPGSGYSSGQAVALTFTGGGGTGVSAASFSPVASSLNVGGGLTKVGSGTLTLTAANTYSGGTTVAAGTLAISGSGTLGATTGGLTMSGGTLDLGGSTNQTVGAVSITAAPSSGNTIQNGSLTGSSYAASNPSGNAIVTANLLDFGTGTSLSMSGAGTLTLAGNNTYSLGTTIQSGTLRAANSTGSATGGGLVQVGGASSSGNPTLAGGGTVGGNVSVSGTGVGLTAGHIAPSGFTGSTGTTLSLGGTLTLATGSGPGTGSVLDFNLANATTVGGSVNDLINITTNSAVNYGTDGVVNINAYDGSLSLGTYTLISDTASLAPTGGAGWTVGTNNDSQSASHTYTISVIGQNLDLVVSAPSYYWTGGTTSWDTTGGTASWVTSAGAPAPFTNSPALAVTFGDTYPNGSGNSTVGNSGGNVSVVVQTGGVTPATVTFNNSTLSYTVSDQFATDTIGIGGTTGITLSGTGNVTLSGVNSFSGAVAVNEGQLILANNLAVGNTSSVAVASGAALSLQTGNGNSGSYGLIANGLTPITSTTIAGAGSGSGALVNISGNNTYAGPITLAAAATIGNTSGVAGDGLTLSGGIGNAGNLLTFTGVSGSNTTVSGNGISGGGGLTLNSSGTLTLSATNGYSGPTQVNSGLLRVTGSLASGSAVTVGGTSAGGVSMLGGSGTINGSVFISGANGGVAGHLAPSGPLNVDGVATASPNTLTISNANGLTLDSGSVLDFNINGTNGSDLVFVNGPLSIGTDGVLNFNGTLAANQFYPLIDYTGGLSSADFSSTWTIGAHNGDSGHNYNLVIEPGAGLDGSDALELHVTTGASSATWISTGDGNFNNGPNWSTGSVPSGVGLTATFGAGSQATVSINSSYTLGQLNFNNGGNSGAPAAYLLTGNGNLTLNNSGSGASVNVSSGTLTPSLGASLTLTLADSSLTTTFNIASGSSLVVGGAIGQASSGQRLVLAGGGTLELESPNTYSGSTTINSGTLQIDSMASVAHTSSVSIAAAGTLQLVGTTGALPSTVNISTHGTGSNGDGALVLIGAATETVGTISGDTHQITDGSQQVTVYSGNTTVGDGGNTASLTATQILQNTLTINAGSTVTIAPSGSGITTDALGSEAVSGVALAAGSSTADSDSSGDPFTAIQAAIASGAISSAKGQQLENRIAAIERLAATDPGLDVSLLEDRVLAALPSASVWSSSGTSPLLDSGSGLLAVDSSSTGSPSGSSLGGSAAFAPAAAFGGSPAAVPEPSTLLLAMLGGVGILTALRRRTIYCEQ